MFSLVPHDPSVAVPLRGRCLGPNTSSKFPEFLILLIMKLRFASFTLGAALLAAPSLFAQTTLVSWGPSASLMDTGAGNTPRTNDATGVLNFNLIDPISPLAFNPGNGRTYSGAPYYGGIVTANAAGLNGGVNIRNAALAGGIDAQVFGRASGTTVGYTATGVFLWKQEDFLAGSDGVTDNVTITSLSYDGLLLAGTGTNLEGRFVLQQGSSYIISDSLGLATFSQVRSLTNLSSVSWYSYTPAGASIGTAAIGASALSSPSFSGVTAAGLYLTAQSTSTADVFTVAFSQFTASGTISTIPEPSAAAHLVGFGVMALVALRRRKR